MTARTDFAFWLSQQPDTIAGLDPTTVAAIKKVLPVDDSTIRRARAHELIRLTPNDPRIRIVLRVLMNRHHRDRARTAREFRNAQEKAWREAARERA